MQLRHTFDPEWPFLYYATVAFIERYILQILSDQVPLLSGTLSIINWLRLINREGTEVDETGEDRWLGSARNSKPKKRMWGRSRLEIGFLGQYGH
jgi:hypothetical protein